MNYEEKYNNLVVAIKQLQEANPCDEGIQNWVDDNVPELCKSEDERMFQEIKKYIKEQGDKPTGLPNGSVAVSDMIAWLEKQQATIARLKSLRPQPHWKPSEDLDAAAECYGFANSVDLESIDRLKEAFIEAAKWQKEQTLEKANEWLKEHVHEYVKLSTISGFYVGTGRLLEDFRKAMEE